MERPELTTSASITARQTVDILVREANQHQQAGRFQAAEAIYRKVLAFKPNLAEAHKQLGKVLIALDRLEGAIRSITRSIEIDSDSSPARNLLGIAFRKQGQTENAISYFKCALQIAPMNVNAHMNLVLTLMEAGQFDESAEHFRQALKINPKLAQAYFHLAHMRKNVSAVDENKAMKSLYNHPNTDTMQKIYLAFGLGSALEKYGAYEEAFEFFQEGHRLKKQSTPFDLENYIHFFKSMMEVFDEGYVSRNRVVGPIDDLPVFIFGMPRSGTTLAEQVLSSHPDIQGAGELNYVEDAVRRVSEITGKPFLVGWGEMDARKIHDLGMQCLDKLRAHSGGYKHVCDTTPMNFLYVGLIATILPGARLVHCLRNPMDTCLSIYQQPLSNTHAYAHEIKDLGGFYKLYKGLMNHWHSILPGRIYDLRYETMVTDNETEIRKLLDYCELPFHENCLTFHKSERSIRTPSASQVRQPIYTTSIDRWKRYETQLSPLKEILQ